MNEEKSVDTLQLLLGLDIPNLPEKEIKLKRLSALAGQPVVFRIKGLPYNKVAEIGKLEEFNVHCCLAGIIEPNLKDKALNEHYGVPTPAELLKKMLLPGEIEDISREIERLSGYRETTIEDVKKK